MAAWMAAMKADQTVGRTVGETAVPTVDLSVGAMAVMRAAPWAGK